MRSFAAHVRGAPRRPRRPLLRANSCAVRVATSAPLAPRRPWRRRGGGRASGRRGGLALPLPNKEDQRGEHTDLRSSAAQVRGAASSVQKSTRGSAGCRGCPATTVSPTRPTIHGSTAHTRESPHLRADAGVTPPWNPHRRAQHRVAPPQARAQRPSRIVCRPYRPGWGSGFTEGVELSMATCDRVGRDRAPSSLRSEIAHAPPRCGHGSAYAVGVARARRPDLGGRDAG